MRLLGSIVVLSALVGCRISKEDFPDRYARAACRSLEECDPDYYEDIFDGDFEECTDVYTDVIELFMEFSEQAGEDYDPQEGRRCVNDVRLASCDDLRDVEVSCEVFE
ncbi:MAG TPA: hypothetical protein QGF58_20780 [Myxococcota bacterium]|nr:hypothetical protein [Myxococcota bacterium]